VREEERWGVCKERQEGRGGSWSKRGKEGGEEEREREGMKIERRSCRKGEGGGW